MKKKVTKKTNKEKYVTKSHFDKTLSNYPTKDDLKIALTNYPTKEDLRTAFKEQELKIDRNMDHILGIYKEHIDDKFKILIEGQQMTNEKLDRAVIEIKSVLNNHERRIITLEAESE